MILMVKMDPEFTVERVFSIAKRGSCLCGVTHSLGGIDQDSRPFHLLRLIGMENGDRVEASIEGLGPLTSHQGHVGLA
jgi:hypothetical protein